MEIDSLGAAVMNSDTVGREKGDGLIQENKPENHGEQMDTDEELLKSLMSELSDRQVYSWSTTYVCEKIGCNRDKLLDLVQQANEKIGCNRDKRLDLVQQADSEDQINIFWYEPNKIEYIGLESRRIDYERDVLEGTNAIHNELVAGKRGPVASTAARAEELDLKARRSGPQTRAEETAANSNPKIIDVAGKEEEGEREPDLLSSFFCCPFG
eukprot:CAMPEP_0181306362 /NCGR_PEP_ID=MMETSP1101-20121128/10256_1 /TAXON_ID=46948 /ORGANISM="Rhodomonas abbreviata, Strain Caron Lab Isolate" /LENGTH=211 /DNA_ID=CAMNT_0023412407 /DNA_START=219 /DNA_END=854 /DNA_ORIENTATION=-